MYKNLQNFSCRKLSNLTILNLYNKYSKYVLKIANIYYSYFKEKSIISYEELTSIASIALIEAWQKYDASKNVPFKSFLRLYSKNFIRTYFRENTLNPAELSYSKIDPHHFENNNNTVYFDPCKNYQFTENKLIIKKSLKKLNKQESKIIKILLDGYSVNETANKLNLKYEKIYYVIKKFRNLTKTFGYIKNLC